MDGSAGLPWDSTARGRESQSAVPGRHSANNRASRSWSLRVGESWFHFPVRRRDKDRRSQRPRKKWKNWSQHSHKKHPMGSYFRARFWQSVVRYERSIATLRLVYINFLHTKAFKGSPASVHREMFWTGNK